MNEIFGAFYKFLCVLGLHHYKEQPLYVGMKINHHVCKHCGDYRSWR